MILNYSGDLLRWEPNLGIYAIYFKLKSIIMSNENKTFSVIFITKNDKEKNNLLSVYMGSQWMAAERKFP